jgi:ATP-dependent Clp protease ATP-binding subunit ClpB
MEINSKPEELDVLDRKIMQLEIEMKPLKRKRRIKTKILGLDLANQEKIL